MLMPCGHVHSIVSLPAALISQRPRRVWTGSVCALHAVSPAGTYAGISVFPWNGVHVHTPNPEGPFPGWLALLPQGSESPDHHCRRVSQVVPGGQHSFLGLTSAGGAGLPGGPRREHLPGGTPVATGRHEPWSPLRWGRACAAACPQVPPPTYLLLPVAVP